MLRIVGRVVRVALASGAAAGLLLAGSTPGRADAGERITRYNVAVKVHADGTAHVREAIRYDFGTNARHGIDRRILYSAPAGQNRRQVMDVTGIRVNSSDGAPDHADISDDGEHRQVRVGDPDRTVTGTHAYVIEYDTDRVASKTGGGVRYAWNAVGSEWDVPVSGVHVRISGPDTASAPRCFAGTPGSSGTSCDRADATGTMARFAQRQVDAGQGLIVQTDLPAGSVTVAPKYGHADSGSDTGDDSGGAFLPSIGSGIAAALLLLIAAVTYGYVRYRKADRNRGPAMPGLPDGMTPGLAAYLIAPGRRSTIVVATVIDLARRGFLRIDDVPGRSDDWMLTRTAPWDPTLPRHEQLLLLGLFSDRDRIAVKQLRNRFHKTASAVTSELGAEARRRGWAREPYLRWIVNGCAVPFDLFAFSQVAGHELNGWPFLLIASGLVGVLLTSAVAPLFRFTEHGEQAHRQVETLRRDMSDPAGAQQFDPEWALPYAAAFGRTHEWESRVTAGGVARFAFYSGAGLAAFSTTAGSSMVSSPSSGSGGSGSSGGGGGSVGGGGGGGGGGSW